MSDRVPLPDPRQAAADPGADFAVAMVVQAAKAPACAERPGPALLGLLRACEESPDCYTIGGHSPAALTRDFS